MNKRLFWPVACLAAALAVTGCTKTAPPRDPGEQPPPAAISSPGGQAPGREEQPAAAGAGAESRPAGPGQQELQQRYMGRVVQEVLAQLIQPGMSEYDKAKAAFDYMIETTTLTDPVGLDIWRVQGGFEEPLPYVENRSLSVLLYGVGKCEDYAAALTMLLQGMGLEAEYLPGLTYSTQGELVDHAWVVAKIDGVWYHLDCQLEQNISRHGSIRYKYFMRSDATMQGSHRWGRNLIASGLLTTEQNEEIALSYLPQACPQDYPTPPRRSFTAAAPPDMTALAAQIDAEITQYESEYGSLAPLELNTVPPVFALEGYGPQE